MHGNLDRYSILLGSDVNGFVNQLLSVLVQIFHEFTQSFFRIENFCPESLRIRIYIRLSVNVKRIPRFR